MFFAEKFLEHLELSGAGELSVLLANRQALSVIVGLLAAFCERASPQAQAEVNAVLARQRERGRRRKKALQQAADALIRAAARYHALEGLVGTIPGLPDTLAQEGLRLLLERERWVIFHKESRLGLDGKWIFLLILEDFVQLASGHQLSLTEMAMLVTGVHHALDPNWLPTVPDELRGFEHFRTNPKNQVLCSRASAYARHLASTLDQRPLLILRNGI